METINKTWKPVTIGGFTGILMGAGAMHFAQSIASTTSVNEEEQAAGTKSLDDLSFREAFETARADMGPGGVFSWHGKLFNTYTAEEWNAMSQKDKELFAQQVKPEVSVEDVDTRDLAISNETNGSVAEASNDITQNSEIEVKVVEEEDLTMASVKVDDKQNAETVSSLDDDVRVIGYGDIDLVNGNSVTVEELEINGQRVAVIDVDKDGVGDVAMSDLNHNNRPDDGEVIDLHTGNPISFDDHASIDDVSTDITIMPA